MPDNSAYFHAAYIAAALIYGGYIVSLVVRARRARVRHQRRESARLRDTSDREA